MDHGGIHVLQTSLTLLDQMIIRVGPIVSAIDYLRTSKINLKYLFMTLNANLWQLCEYCA